MPSSIVITITAVNVGSAGNYPLVSSDDVNLTVSGATMLGGVDSDVDNTLHSIHHTAHGLGTGEPVVYTVSAGTTVSGLTDGTTYYAIKVDADNFKLATSKDNAVAGTAIAISTDHTVGGGSFSLDPGTESTVIVAFAGSNDGRNYTAMSGGATLTGTGNLFVQIPTVSFKFVRVNTNVTTGAADIKLTPFGKN